MYVISIWVQKDIANIFKSLKAPHCVQRGEIQQMSVRLKVNEQTDSISVKPLHNHDIVSVHFNHFY